MLRRSVKVTLAILLVGFFVSGITLFADSSDQTALFTGNENHYITLEEASNFTEAYRNQMQEGQTIGGFFGRDAIEAILDQDDAVGLRVYNGMDDQGQEVLVLVGTNKDGDDMYHGKLAERSLPCPPYCGFDNPLNSNQVRLANR